MLSISAMLMLFAVFFWTFLGGLYGVFYPSSDRDRAVDLLPRK